MKKKCKFLVLYFLMFLNLFSMEKKEVKIIDNVGREIKLSVPVERAVVALRYNNELIRACGAIDQVVAVDMNTAQDREYWSNFSTNNIIGKNQKSLNYERIISLNPEVLILPSNGTYTEAEKKLAPFGIKVVVVSGYDTNDFYNQVKNIGIIFGKEKESKDFLNFYEKPLKYIQENLKDVEKKKVYWEDTKDYYTSFPGSYYYNMIVSSGGENIFGNENMKMNVSEVSPESIILKNPEFIIKHVSPAQALKGTGVYHAPLKSQMDETIESIKKRPGWDSVNAVKNNNIYLMSQFGHGGASKMIGAVYMAKWMYPNELKDLNPDEIFREWLEKYQGFKYIDGHFYPGVNN